jgi:hypothetical protein
VKLAVALPLARAVWTQIVDIPHTFGLCLLHLRWLLTSKILHEKALAAIALLLAKCPQTPAWMSFNISCPS